MQKLSVINNGILKDFHDDAISYRLTRADSRIFERSRPPGVYVNGFGPPGRLRLLARAAGIFGNS